MSTPASYQAVSARGILAELREAGWPLKEPVPFIGRYTTACRCHGEEITLSLAASTGQQTLESQRDKLARHGLDDDLAAARSGQTVTTITATEESVARTAASATRTGTRAAAASEPQQEPSGPRKVPWETREVTGWNGRRFNAQRLPQPELVQLPDGSLIADTPTVLTWVTPQTAALWLEHPVCNTRPVKTATVRKTVNHLNAGTFDTTHQGFAVCREHGGLLDGMNRCRGIVRVDRPALVKVTYAVPHAQFMHMDSGANRTTGDYGAISQLLDPELGGRELNLAMALVKMVAQYDRTPQPVWTSWLNSAMPTEELVAALGVLEDRDPGMVSRAASDAQALAPGIGALASGVALGLYLIWRAWPDCPYTPLFVQATFDGTGLVLERGDAIHTLREFYRKSGSTTAEKRKRDPIVHAAALVKAFNLFTVSQLLSGTSGRDCPPPVLKGGKRPEHFPVPHTEQAAHAAAARFR